MTQHSLAAILAIGTPFVLNIDSDLVREIFAVTLW